jgi:hypothetical protein
MAILTMTPERSAGVRVALGALSNRAYLMPQCNAIFRLPWYRKSK